MNSYAIKIKSVYNLSDQEFYDLCIANPDIKFERNAKGDLVVMSPTGGETGKINMEIGADFVLWNRQNKLGVVFDSSTCFRLPQGSMLSPDVAWIKLDRWDKLTNQEKQKFPPIAPDFVLELMSPSDNLKELQEKMRDYIDNGVKLGWLINRQNQTVEIYSPDQSVVLLPKPTTLSGEPILPGFELDFALIW